MPPPEAEAPTVEVVPLPDARRRHARRVAIATWVDRVGWGAAFGFLCLTLAPLIWLVGVLLRGCGDP